MNDLNAILAKIGEEAKECREKTLEAARREAERIEAEFTAQGKAESAAAIEAAKAQAAAIEQRAQSQAGLVQRNASLTARRKTIDAAFARSLQMLRQLPDDQLVEFYAALAVSCISGDAELILCQRDKDAFGAALAQRIAELSGKLVTLAETSGNFLGGFVLREGSIETNCTFEVLNSNAKEELEGEVASILFA
ncbi:MAG: V-type ATP synthase subunit E [Angelakisella sp.]|nr:V-type ATP synthase subunit E [Angelakisella sp.]